MLRIFSWNVNGVRAVLRKGEMQNFLEKFRPDILCLQEIKAKSEQVEYDFPGYKVYWNPAKRPGYSGTATLVADFLAPSVLSWTAGELDASEKEVALCEGRILVLEFTEFYLVNVYTPNSKPDLSRLELRHKAWDPGFFTLLKTLEKKKPVITCGDFNAAHEEIDLARPAANHHNAGFTDEEREGITSLVKAGFVDTFRILHPEERRYSWWSHWGHARENNVGWRIDYFFISQAVKSKLIAAEIHENVMGSDHCPVSIELKI